MTRVSPRTTKNISITTISLGKQHPRKTYTAFNSTLRKSESGWMRRRGDDGGWMGGKQSIRLKGSGQNPRNNRHLDHPRDIPTQVSRLLHKTRNICASLLSRSRFDM